VVLWREGPRSPFTKAVRKSCAEGRADIIKESPNHNKTGQYDMFHMDEKARLGVGVR
jgi:hypothetical protein